MEVAKTNVPASAKEMVANASKTAAEIAAQTAIPTKHIYKALFSHSIPMSSFVFKDGKTVTFRGGVYGTDDERQIRELRETCMVNPLIIEIDPEGKAPLRTAEDIQREQARNILG